MTFEVNGKTIKVRVGKSRFSRTEYQLTESILSTLQKIGISSDYIDIPMPRDSYTKQKKKEAEIRWYVNGEEHYYRADKQDNYRDNLGVISKVIEMDVYAIRNGMKTFGQVMNQFKIGYDPSGKKIRSPREILGIGPSVHDKEYITYLYKQKAKQLHPDTENGDAEKFKELKEAFDQLTKEML